MGGVGAAYEYTKAALEKGKSVVTSNKELVAIKGDELFQLASKNGVKYFYEASVGGGIPIIRPILTSLGSNEIKEITGILNGTTNYILTKMFKDGESFDNALKTAQELGYAERNPSADVDGHDTCKKISILSSMIIGKKVNHEDVHTTGITAITLEDTKYAEKMGYSIKLLGRFKNIDGEYEVMVEPAFVKNDSPLAGVEDVFNGIFVNGDMLGEAMFYGRGAGKLPTASAVVADVIEVVKGAKDDIVVPWVSCDKKIIKDYEKISSRFFVRVKSNGRNEAELRIKKEFSNVEVIDITDTEAAFVTGVVTIAELNNKLKAFELLSRFMIL